MRSSRCAPLLAAVLVMLAIAGGGTPAEAGAQAQPHPEEGVRPVAEAAAPHRPSYTGAFRAVELGLGVVGDPGTGGALHRYWSPGTGIEATARTPFYTGALELGLQQAHHDARRGDVPGFRARLLFVGWGTEAAVARRLALGAGARLGMYEMRFDGDTIPDFRRDESELGTAVRTTLAYAPGARWRVHAAAAYQVVYTQRRVEQLLLSAGVGRSFPMPSWLRDFLD